MISKIKNIIYKYRYILIIFIIGIVSIISILKINQEKEKTNNNDIGYSYELQPNGDIVSTNMFEWRMAERFGTYNVYDGVVSGIDTKRFFAFQLQRYYNNTLVSETLVGNYTTTGVLSYSFRKTSAFNRIQFGHNGSVNDIKISYRLNENFIDNEWYTISFNLLSYNQNISFDNVMINEGEEPLPYEPFGVWYNSYNIQASYPFYSNDWTFVSGRLNGTDIFTSNNVVKFNNDYVEISPYYLRNLNGFNTSFNNQITLTFANYNSNRQSSISSYSVKSPMISSDYFNISFYKNVDELQLNTPNYNSTNATGGIYEYVTPVEFDKITITIKTTRDYSTSETSIFSANVGNYREGYQYGYNQGKNDGYSQGYQNGESAGYQRGANDYADSSLANNGLKTLFNSILSYPVNMIKSVFDFDFMGVNIASVIMFVISIGIVAFVIKKFL